MVSVYFERATCLQLMNMLRIVVLTLICMSVCCAFAEDSYQESKPGNEKRKSEQAVVIARQNIVSSIRHIHGPKESRL